MFNDWIKTEPIEGDIDSLICRYTKDSKIKGAKYQIQEYEGDRYKQFPKSYHLAIFTPKAGKYGITIADDIRTDWLAVAIMNEWENKRIKDAE